MSLHNVTDYDPWVAPCSRTGGRGAYVLQGYILAESPWDDSYNLGIYNCRPPSVHGHERAGDTGFPLVNGKAHPQGFELAEWLWKNRDHFGIQVVIWNRKIISRPKPYWHDYTGVSPHVDHVHWELNWWGYWNVTLKLIDQYPPTDTSPITVLPPTEYTEEQMATAFQYNNDLDTFYLEGDKVYTQYYQTSWKGMILLSGCKTDGHLTILREFRKETGRIDLFIEAQAGGLNHTWFKPGVGWSKEHLPSPV